MKALCLIFAVICYVLGLAAAVMIVICIINHIRPTIIISLSLSLVTCVVNGIVFWWRYKDLREIDV